MNDPTLLARVQELLDERRDPLDDADVRTLLDAHPEWLPRVVGLRADAAALAALAAGRRQPAARTRRWRWPLSATFAATAAALVASLLGTPPPPSAGRILTASLTELRPRAHVAATIVVNEHLVATPTSRLQTWQTRSEPR